MENYNYFVLLMVFLSSILAGFVDSIVGGGGLITVPTLMLLNLPPKLVLGTNKFQSTFGSCTAAFYYLKYKLANWKDAKWGIVFTAIGATSGTFLVRFISNDFLANIMPFFLILMACYMLVSKKLGVVEKKARLGIITTFVILGLSIGFYDGFFGPGTGNFWAIGLIILLGMNLKKATAYTKIMNFTSNLVALIIFASSGLVLYKLGLIMGIGQFIGARLGAKVVIKSKAEFIRPIFITMVFLISIYLVYKQFFPLYRLL